MDEAPSQPRRRNLKRFGLAAACGVAALVLIVAVVVNAPPTRRWALQRALVTLEQQGIRGRAERLEWSLSRLRFRLYGVSLSAGPSDAAPFLEAGEIEIDLPVRALRGEIALESLVVRDARVRLLKDAAGIWNLPSAAAEAPAGAAAPITLPIDRLELDGVRIELQDPAAGLDARLSGISAMLEPSATGTSGAVAAEEGSIAWPDHRVPIELFELGLDYDGRNLAFANARVVAPPLRIEGAGRLADVLSSGPIETNLRVTTDAAELLRLANIEAIAGGMLQADVEVRGPLASPATTWSIVGDDMSWEQVTDLRLTARGALSASAFALELVRIERGEATVEASGDFDIESGAGAWRASWNDVDLESALGGMLDESAIRPTAFLTGELQAGWSTPTYDAAALRLTTTLRPGETRAGRIPIAASVVLDREPGGDVHAEFDAAAVDMGRIDAVIVARPPVDFFASDWRDIALEAGGRLEVPDVARAVARLAALDLVSPLDDDLGPRGSVAVDFEAGGTAGRPALIATMSSSDLVVAGVEIDQADARLALEGPTITLDRLQLRSGADTISAEGHLAGPDGGLDLRVDATIGEIAELLEALPEPWRAHGRVDARAVVGGVMSAPSAAVRVRSGSFEIAGQRAETAMADLAVDRDGFRLQRAELVQSNGGKVSARGAGSWDGAAAELTIELDGFDVAPVPSVDASEPPIPFRALAGGSIELRVAGAERAVDGRLALDDVMLADALIGRIELAASTGPELLEVVAVIPSLGMRAAAGFDLSAAGDPEAPVDIDIELWIEDLDLARLAALVPGGSSLPVTGLASSHMALAGRLDDPASWAADIDLQRLTAEVGSTPIRLLAPGRIEYSAGRAAADVVVTVGAATLRIDGISATGSGELVGTLTGDLADLEDLASLAAEIGAALGEETPIVPDSEFFLRGSGPFRLVARLGGDAASPTLAAELDLNEAELGFADLPPISDVNVRASLAEGIVRVDRAEGRWLDSRLVVSGRIPVSLFTDPRASGEEATLDLRVENLTLAAVAEHFDPSLAQRGEARVTARASLVADALEIGAVRGELVFEEAAVAAAGVGIEQRVPTRLRLENGELTVVDWSWSGAAGDVDVRGSATLGAQPTYDLTLEGDLDLRTMRLLLPASVTSTGRIRWTARATGSGDNPVLDGAVELEGAELRVLDPRISVTELRGALRLEPGRIVVDGVAGVANGGPVTLEGGLDYGPDGVSAGEIRLSGRGVAVEAVEGLRTLVDLDLALQPAAQPMALTGEITVLRGSYGRRLSLTSELVEALARGELPGGAAESLADMRLDIRIVTEEDVLVDNNLARLQLSADLQLRGTAGRPVLSGRAELAEGGQVFLGGNTYRVEAGSVDFVDPTGIVPDLTLTAVTVVSNYEITLNATGPPDTLEIELSSDPALDRSDLISVLVTGRTLDQAGSTQTQVAQEQVAGFLTGELAARAGNAIGLDAVRLERGVGENADFDPLLVATETDPSMRLTLSKRVGPDLELTFSQNLREAGGFTWIVGYRVLRNLELRAVSRDNNDRSYEFSHDLRFGGGTPEARSRAPQPRISSVTLSGDLGDPENDVRARLRLSSGDRFDVFRWQDDRDRLESWYRDRGYLEARVRTRSEDHPPAGEDRPPVAEGRPPAGGGMIDLFYDIQRGPATRIVIEGHAFPESARQRMEEAWRRSVIDDFLVEEIQRIARESLASAGYLDPRVDVQLDEEANAATKVARVGVRPGARSTNRRIRLTGNQQVDEATLRAYVVAQGLESSAWLDPVGLSAALEEYYRQLGFLDATVAVQTAAVVGDSVSLPVNIDEGPRYRVAALHLEGVESRLESAVAAETGLAPGSIYVPSRLRGGRRVVEAGYRARGFASVEVDTRAEIGTDGNVDVTIAIREGRRQIVERVDVFGTVQTRESFVRDRLGVEPGMPVDLAGLYQARRRLYQTGVFRRVDISVEPLEPAGQDDVEPVAVVVTVQERPRFRFRYGLAVSDERFVLTDTVQRDLDLGASSDLIDRNLFGRALTTGLSVRYERDNQVARTYLSAPYFLGLPLTSTAFLTRSREALRGDAFFPLIVDRTGLALEQRFRVLDLLDVSYSYSFERNHTFDENLDPDNPFAFDITVDIARFTVGGVIDRRDDVFDATRGWSLSTSFENSLPALGSDLRFLRFLAQQTYFHPLGRGVVLASAARLGLATAFDQELIFSERFFAGGGNSVRGYAEDSLGPADFFGDALGGSALLVLKQEARFPLFWVFRGVTFLDAGNVFERVADLSVSDLESSWGVGLRVDTPFVLVRMDYGFRIGRDPGDPRGRFFFSIGQAF